MNRAEQWKQLQTTPTWDLVIIGGGATGLGTAVDAAARGLKTLLLERDDFGKGTSSRSTKLVHGGVRYLAQGNIKLVREALRERAFLLKNAPHLSHTQHFVIPAYSWFDLYFYYFGLLCYDFLAGKLSLGATQKLNRTQTLAALPALAGRKPVGGIRYTDGQFDDARLCVELATTAVALGATVLNGVVVKDLWKDENGKVVGVVAANEIQEPDQRGAMPQVDALAKAPAEKASHAAPKPGELFRVKAKVVVNATGVFVDPIRQMEAPGIKSLVKPSQGIHLVIDQKHFPGTHALMVPKTADGRVLFAVPWQGHVVVGTTDTPLSVISDEPRALEKEVQFVLDHFNQYTGARLQREQVAAVFAGLRPLVNMPGQNNTALLARDHTIEVSPGQLITITGGKWTTYRKMAEDVVNNVVFVGGFRHAGPCITRDLRLGWGAAEQKNANAAGRPWQELAQGLGGAAYRQEGVAALLREHPAWAEKLHPGFVYCVADVVWAVRFEMALSVEDVLARRLRMLFLDARAAMAATPKVVQVMAKELGHDKQWAAEEIENFLELARGYVLDALPLP